MNPLFRFLVLPMLVLTFLGCKQERKGAGDGPKEDTRSEDHLAEAQHEDPTPLEIGAGAPAFSLPATDGKTYTLDDFSNYKYLVVLFTCNHCPTAQAYEDKFIKIVDTYKNKDIGFVAISPNSPEAISLSELGYSDLSDSMEEMKLRSKLKNYNFPYLYDGETQKTSLAYGPAATPHAFVFDESRNLVYRGRIDDTENPYIKPKTEDLSMVLNALVAGNTLHVERTKTFGCSIKWAWKGDWAKKQLQEWSKEEVGLEEIDLEGVEKLFKNDSGKLLLINLWATWCGPCIMEMPELITINRMYRDRDFQLVTITTDKMNKKEKALEILTNKEASAQNFIFNGEDVYELIEVVDPEWQGALPYTALIAPEGKVLYKVQGTFDPPKLKMAIVDKLGRYYADN